MPVQFHVHFGEPMRFSGRFDDEDTVIDEKVKQVSDVVKLLIAKGLAERTSVF